jgi:hypothetical protein
MLPGGMSLSLCDGGRTDLGGMQQFWEDGVEICLAEWVYGIGILA